MFITVPDSEDTLQSLLTPHDQKVD
jgi:hypothetical protein